MNDQAILDLSMCGDLAKALVKQLCEGKEPNQFMLNKLRDLAEKVQRQYDPQLEAMGNVEA